MKFRLLIDFESEMEMIEYLLNAKRSQAKKLTKTKDNDLRGSKTTELHRKAKEYKTNHPDTPYKECLSVVSHPEVKTNEVIEELKQEVKIELIEEVDKQDDKFSIMNEIF